MTLAWASKFEFTTDANAAYKFKAQGGGWTPLLHYVKSEGGLAFFKPVEDNESTLTHSVLRMYITAEQDASVKEFKQCKFYGTWEKAPHVCGKDCPLGV
jgi:hypothetical protein